MLLKKLSKKRYTLLFLIFFFLFDKAFLFASSLTIEEEKKLGDKFIIEAFKSYKIVKDYTVSKYINSLGKNILKTFPNPPFKYNFYVIDSDDYNAFAAPSGHIFINSGLIAVMENEEELAGILTHEISHVYLRHIASMFDKSKVVGVVVLAGVLAGMFLASSTSSDVGEAAIFGSFAAGQTKTLSYSREHEIQADQVGIKHLILAGYTSSGLISVLEKIKKKSIYNDIPQYLKTHPMLDDRISYLKTAKTIFKGKKEKKDNFLFEITKARIIAYFYDKLDALNYFEEKIKKDKNNPIYNYGYSLILSILNRKEEAIKYIDRAIDIKRETIFLTGKMEILVLHNDYKEAFRFAETINSKDKNHKFIFLRAKANFLNNNYNEAIKDIETIIKKAPNFNEAFFLLSKCYGRLNKLNDAYRNLALYYEKEHQPKKAAFYKKKVK